MKRFLIVFLAAVAVALGGFSVALADPGNGNGPPATNPGSPGDDCSHGNADKPCKDDPQPDRGKDCEDHGNARGNEDHCEGTTTTPEEPPVVTEPPVTTTPEGPTSTPTTPTDQESTPGPVTAPESSPTPGSAAKPTPRRTPKSQQSKPVVKAQVVKTAPTVKAGVVKAKPAEAKTLPYTGVPVGLYALLGVALMGGGLLMRRWAS